MAKMLCRCGNKLSNNVSPNEVELYVYSQIEWDKISNLLGSLEDLPHPENDVWRCPVCERIYFFEGNKAKKVYVLEPETQDENSVSDS